MHSGGPAWLRRMASRTRIDEMREFENQRERQRFLIGALVVLALIGIVAGVASGASVSGAAKALLTPDAGTATFVAAIVLLNLVWAVTRWRGQKRQRADTPY